MSQPSRQTVLDVSHSNPFLESDIPDSEEMYEPTPFGIAALSNVDHLMDDLFGGIETLLVRGAPLPDLHPQPKPEAASPLLMPAWQAQTPAPEAQTMPFPVAEPAPFLETENITDSLGTPDDLLSDPDLDELLGMASPASNPRKSGNSWLSAGVATLLLTGGLFVGVKYRLYERIAIPAISLPGQSSSTQATVPQAAQSGSTQPGHIQPGHIQPGHKDQQFLDYISRSLNRIDRTAHSAPPATANPGVAALPSVPGSPGVVEHYVPVYQPPLFGSFTNQPSPAPGVTPPGSPAPVTTTRTTAPASPAIRPAAVPPPSAAAPVAAAPAAPMVAVPAAPAPVAVAPAAPAAIVPNFDPSETHALIGLLELGDRSAALLSVNGVPQRIEVGSKIGASGWQILSISNQAAIIQRNGETRSIYVGQQF